MKKSFACLLPVFSTAALVGCSGTSMVQNVDAWEPVDAPMLTRWADDVNPKMPLPEYPRPQMERKAWQNLNGLWNYAVVDQGQEADGWDGQILVPYPIESALSGVNAEFKDTELLIYQRTFEVSNKWRNDRIMLNFGAVDYRSEILVNGQVVGSHEGGFDPFSFDITDFLVEGKTQEVVVKVTDPTWMEGIPRGKQTMDPGGIMYIPTSGIWQTVWLEPVAKAGVEDLHIVPNVEAGNVKVSVDLFNGAQGEITIKAAGQTVTGKAGETITVPVEDAELWSPENPHLYDMTVTVSQDGKKVDSVDTYFGMRSIEMAEVDGETQVLLNGEPYFMFGPLDQGFWPDGCYTAPTDEALRYDLEITKELGFNSTRKHIKVEPARWYYHADQIGLLVWQDMPSANSYDAGNVPGGHPPVDKKAYRTQLSAMMDNLENHPSIVKWVVFNESQGKHDVESLVKLVRDTDPSRLVNEDSGYFRDYVGVGDFNDRHPYPAPRLYQDVDSNAYALGEYGGIGLKVGNNNPWQSKGWGYTNTESGEELENLYAQYCGKLNDYRLNHGLTSAIYTQITDVEIEINGLLTYDRVLKVDPEWIAKATNFEWFGPEYTAIVPTSQEDTQSYMYTFQNPGNNWMGDKVETAKWQSGEGGFGSNGTPGIGRLGTEWTSSDIWVRRTVELPALSDEQVEQLVLSLYHDEDVVVFINGVLAFEAEGFVSGYTNFPISEEAKKALNLGGKNTVAIHCKQTQGGQYVDFGIGTLDPARD